MSAPRCAVCHDSGSKNQTGDYLDCPACDMPHTRKALNDFVKSLGPTHPEDVALAIHKRALAMAPKQEGTSNNELQKLKDAAKRAGMASHLIEGKLRDDMFVIGKDFIERLHAELEKLCPPIAAPAAANGALTDAQIKEICKSTGWIPEWNDRDHIKFARAILAAAGPDAAMVKALDSALAIINNEADPDEYAAPLKLIRAAISGAKGN